MSRTQAYGIITAIISQGKSSIIAKKYPEMVKYVTKDNYVDVKKFNKDFPSR